MAILASNQSGNFTSASTWSMVDATSYSASEVATSAVSTTFLSSAAFTTGAITIDGMGARLLQTQTVPLGTFSVRLALAGVAVAGTTVTINVSDIPNGTNSVGGWVFFKFATPVTLIAATAYTMQIACSVNGHVTSYRTATLLDWSRFLRTTTTQAPAATDTLIVSGDYTGAGTSNTTTVTMDNTTTTNFASLEVCGKGILENGVVASTAYQLRIAGIARVTGAGTWTIGTLANPIPVSSSALLRFVNTVNVDFGLEIRGVSIFTTYGATKTGRAYLNADAAAAATTITTDVSTGWLSGDAIVLASTTTTVAQTESVTLSANATGTSVPVSVLGFAHSGSNPTKAEIMNVSRNVRIIGTSGTLQAYINNALGAFAAISCNFTEFQFLGSGVANKRGIDIATTGVGSTAFNGCAFRNFTVSSSIAIVIGTSVANTTIDDCVFFSINANAVSFSASALASVSVTNCWAFTNTLAGNALFAYSSQLPTMSGIVAVSSFSGFGITISTNDIVTSSVSNLTAHSNGAGGISFIANSQLSTPPVFNNLTMWSNTTRNLSLNSCVNLEFNNLTIFSGAGVNIDFITTASANLTFRNVTSNAGSVSPVTNGIRFSISCDKIVFIDSSFGQTTAHSFADFNTNFVRGFLGCNLYNCTLTSTTEVIGLTAISYNSYISSSKHDGISGEFKTFTSLGNITKDYVIFDATNLGLSASTRLTPTSVASKLSYDKTIAVPSGRALKITAAVRTSVVGDGTAYNGALPQLVVKKNHALGLLTDTVLATATVASSGAFEIITGTTAVATDSGAFTFCVICDGTTGWVNADSWIVEII